MPIVVLALVACNDELPSRWVTSPITVDGQPDEWERMPLFHFEEHEFAFAVQNDADNLYLYFSTSSPRDQRLLSRLGVTVWLNEDGDEEETGGIRFWPTAVPRRRMPPGGGPEVSDPSVDDEARLSRPTFQTVRNDAVGELDAEVGEMSFRGNLAFEIRLPVRSDSPELALGFEVPEAPRPAQSGRGKSKGGGMMKMGGGRGGGMGGGGGMRGRGMGGGSGMGESSDEGRGKRRRPEQAAPASEVIWVTVVPARP